MVTSSVPRYGLLDILVGRNGTSGGLTGLAREEIDASLFAMDLVMEGNDKFEETDI